MNQFQRIIDLREALGGRRFLLSVGCVAVSTILFSLGTLSEGGFITLILATGAAYITGNVVQKVAGK